MRKLFLFFISSLLVCAAYANEGSLITPPNEPIPNPSVLQPSPMTPESEVEAAAVHREAEAKHYRRRAPICIERMKTPPPTDADLDFNAMMAPGIQMSKWKFLFGKGDDETTVENMIEDLIVRFDHALVVGSTNKAKHLIVEVNLSAIFKGKAHFALTVENMWSVVEFAQVRMEAALQRAAYLNRLKEKEGTNDPASIAKIDALIHSEWQAYLSQAWWFGRYFKIYSRLRKHAASILRNQRCSQSCKRKTRWLLEDLGTRDRRVLSIRKKEDDIFNASLIEQGLPAAVAQTQFFEDLVTAANFSTLLEVKSDAMDTVPSEVGRANQRLVVLDSEHDYWAQAGKIAETVSNPIDPDEMQRRSLEAYIQNVMNTAEGRTQILSSVERIFSKPPAARASMFLTDKIPGFAGLRNTPLMKWWFSRIRITELNEDYSYDLTRINRDPSIDIGTLLVEIRHLSAKGSEDDSGIDEVLELIVKRPDLLDMWMKIVEEVSKPDADVRNADLKARVKVWEDKRQAGALKAISPVYRISPWENFLRFAAYVSAGAYSAIHPDSFHQVSSFLFHTLPGFLFGQ